MSFVRKFADPAASWAPLAAGFLLLFGDVLRRLVGHWRADENYSHGFLIIPIAVYLAWERWPQIRNVEVRPQKVAGLIVIAGAISLLTVGTLASEFFLTRVALVITVAGMVLFLFGRSHLRCFAFPIAFLLFMIPIPAILFNQIAFPLQLLASRFGETVVAAAGVPVLREGNIITLANTRLEVAEACSGIRSLVSLFTLGIVFGYFGDKRSTVRAALALATIPLAIVANGLRVAGTGIAAHHFGPEVAEGFFHTFSGWLVFITAFVMLAALLKLIQLVIPAPTTPSIEPVYT